MWGDRCGRYVLTCGSPCQYTGPMPGARGSDERTVLVQVRLTEREAAAWREHVAQSGGYLSALVRQAVLEHLAVSRGKARCPHWE